MSAEVNVSDVKQKVDEILRIAKALSGMLRNIQYFDQETQNIVKNILNEIKAFGFDKLSRSKISDLDHILDFFTQIEDARSNSRQVNKELFKAKCDLLRKRVLHFIDSSREQMAQDVEQDLKRRYVPLLIQLKEDPLFSHIIDQSKIPGSTELGKLNTERLLQLSVEIAAERDHKMHACLRELVACLNALTLLSGSKRNYSTEKYGEFRKFLSDIGVEYSAAEEPPFSCNIQKIRRISLVALKGVDVPVEGFLPAAGTYFRDAERDEAEKCLAAAWYDFRVMHEEYKRFISDEMTTEYLDVANDIISASLDGHVRNLCAVCQDKILAKEDGRTPAEQRMLNLLKLEFTLYEKVQQNHLNLVENSVHREMFDILVDVDKILSKKEIDETQLNELCQKIEARAPIVGALVAAERKIVEKEEAAVHEVQADLEHRKEKVEKLSQKIKSKVTLPVTEQMRVEASATLERITLSRDERKEQFESEKTAQISANSKNEENKKVLSEAEIAVMTSKGKIEKAKAAAAEAKEKYDDAKASQDALNGILKEEPKKSNLDERISQFRTEREKALGRYKMKDLHLGGFFEEPSDHLKHLDTSHYVDPNRDKEEKDKNREQRIKLLNSSNREGVNGYEDFDGLFESTRASFERVENGVLAGVAQAARDAGEAVIRSNEMSLDFQRQSSFLDTVVDVLPDVLKKAVGKAAGTIQEKAELVSIQSKNPEELVKEINTLTENIANLDASLEKVKAVVRKKELNRLCKDAIKDIEDLINRHTHLREDLESDWPFKNFYRYLVRNKETVQFTNILKNLREKLEEYKRAEDEENILECIRLLAKGMNNPLYYNSGSENGEKSRKHHMQFLRDKWKLEDKEHLELYVDSIVQPMAEKIEEVRQKRSARAQQLKDKENQAFLDARDQEVQRLQAEAQKLQGDEDASLDDYRKHVSKRDGIATEIEAFEAPEAEASRREKIERLQEEFSTLDAAVTVLTEKMDIAELEPQVQQRQKAIEDRRATLDKIDGLRAEIGKTYFEKTKPVVVITPVVKAVAVGSTDGEFVESVPLADLLDKDDLKIDGPLSPNVAQADSNVAPVENLPVTPTLSSAPQSGLITGSDVASVQEEEVSPSNEHIKEEIDDLKAMQLKVKVGSSRFLVQISELERENRAYAQKLLDDYNKTVGNAGNQSSREMKTLAKRLDEKGYSAALQEALNQNEFERFEEVFLEMLKYLKNSAENAVSELVKEVAKELLQILASDTKLKPMHENTAKALKLKENLAVLAKYREFLEEELGNKELELQAAFLNDAASPETTAQNMHAQKSAILQAIIALHLNNSIEFKDPADREQFHNKLSQHFDLLRNCTEDEYLKCLKDMREDLSLYRVKPSKVGKVVSFFADPALGLGQVSADSRQTKSVFVANGFEHIQSFIHNLGNCIAQIEVNSRELAQLKSPLSAEVEQQLAAPVYKPTMESQIFEEEIARQSDADKPVIDPPVTRAPHASMYGKTGVKRNCRSDDQAVISTTTRPTPIASQG